MMEAWQVFEINFNNTISREEHKTIFSVLRISEMNLSNPCHFPGFFTPWKDNLKISINSGLGQVEIAGPRKMTLDSWFHQILFSDLAR
jgi:hypothetical protein